MNFTVDEDSLKKAKLTLPEALMILIVKTGVDISELLHQMKEKQMIVEENTLLGKSLMVTQRWSELCEDALLKADKSVPSEDRIEKLAKTLMELFPQGKKEGTSQYWRGNIKDVTHKLRKFFKLYGNKYTDQQIITATQNYISSFNGNYQYMRVLKHFLWKDVRKINADGEGYTEEVSDLATFIENAGHEEELRNDWTSNIA